MMASSPWKVVGEDVTPDEAARNIAGILESGCVPFGKSDRVVNFGSLDTKQWETPGNDLHRVLEQTHRVDPTFNPKGKVYIGALCRPGMSGDPRAWVSDRTDIKRAAIANRLNLSGMVEHKGPELPPAPMIPISKESVDREVQRNIQANPDLAHVNQTKLREEVADRITPDWRKS